MSISNLSATKFPNLSNADYVQRVDAFMLSEEMYVNNFLRVLFDVQKLLTSYNQLHKDDPIVSDDEVSEIFNGIQSIYQFSKGLLEKLTAQRWLGIEEFILNLSTILDQNIPFFKMYGNYILGVKKSIRKLKELTNDKKRPIKNFLIVAELTIGNGLNILIEAPVNRWPLYLRYVNSIADSLDEEHPAYENLQASIKKILEVTDKIAENAENATRRGRVVELQNTELRKLALIDPTRKCYRSSEQKIKDNGKYKTYSFHLFSDFILGYSSDFFGGGVKAFIPLAGAKISVLAGSALSLHIMCPLISKEFDLSFANDKEYYKWLVDIKEVYGSLHVSQAKMLHPNDLEKTIKQEHVTGTMIVRPEASSLDTVTQAIQTIRASRRGDVQGDEDLASPVQKPETQRVVSVAQAPPNMALQRQASAPPPPQHHTTANTFGTGDAHNRAPPVIPSKPALRSPPSVPTRPVPTRPGTVATSPEQQHSNHTNNHTNDHTNSNNMNHLTIETEDNDAHHTHEDTQPPPPSMPAPPSMAAPPASATTTPLNGGPPRMDLLSAIRGGATLKKVEDEESAEKVVDSHTNHMNMIKSGLHQKKVEPSPEATPKREENSLLAGIRGGGMKLRKVEIEEKTVSPVSDNPLFAQIQSGIQLRKVEATPKKKANTTSALGMSEDVQKSLANYRKFVQEESDDESEEW